jgi:hypothetical protein
MTLTIEVAPEEEQALKAKAESNGQTLDEFLRDLVKREAKADQQDSTQVVTSARLAALKELDAFARSLPDHRKEAGLPPLDLSGARGDVYGYTEREDDQL